VSSESPRSLDGQEEALAAFSWSLAQALELDEPVPRAVALRAAVDPMFLRDLIEERPGALAGSPVAARAVGASLPKWAPPPTSALLGAATKALARWALIGFRPVPEAQVQTRKAACQACPELRPPGQHLVHRLVGAGQSQVCGLCACAIDKKANLPTETCPAPSDDPAVNRWGEPRDPTAPWAGR
jgi:hypothetical protein